MHAVLADIHANLEALSAVLADIRARGIERIICLGDVLGFGPDPVACVELAMEFDVVTRGCHDHRIFANFRSFNQTVATGCAHDLKQLKAGWSGRKRIKFLKQLPLAYEEDGVTYAHSFPVQEDWAWFVPIGADPSLSDAETINNQTWRRQGELVRAAGGPTLIGHAHAPGTYGLNGLYRSASAQDHRVQIQRGEPMVVDVGAVGWPRDKDPRACYATVDGDTLEWHRVEYDHKATTAKLLELPMPPSAAEFRLEAGF